MTDTRGGIPATQKQNLFQAIVAVTKPQPDGTRPVVRYGGAAIALAGLVLLGLSLAGVRRRLADRR